MKNILILILLMFAGYVSQAQYVPQSMGVTAADDTTVNADTAHVTMVQNVSIGYDNVFKLTITKLTGTVAGYALLQGYDGNNWFTLASSTGAEIAGQYTEDTATLTNATASYYWKVSKDQATYSKYRFSVRTSGTSTTKPTGIWYYLRRQD